MTQARLIVVEGPNLAGKSTYIQTLLTKRLLQDPRVDNSRIHFMAAGPPTHKDPAYEWLVPLTGLHRDPRNVIVCDRWHIGELVYPKLFDREPIADVSRVFRIDKVLCEVFDYQLIIKMPPKSVIRDRYVTRGDELLDAAMIDKEYSLWEDAIATVREHVTHVPHIEIGA